MDNLKEFIKICNKMYIKQIKRIIKLISKDAFLNYSTKNNLLASGELLVEIIKLMNKNYISVALPSLRNCYEMTLKGIVLDDNDEIRNSYNRIIKLKEKDGMDNVRRYIGENFSKYFYVIEKDENFEKILGEGLLTYVYKTLCRYSHATKVNEFVYIAEKDDRMKEILSIYLTSMLVYPIVAIYVDAVCTKIQQFELDENMIGVFSITMINILIILMRNKEGIVEINELSKKILGEPDELFKKIEKEKSIYSYAIEDFNKSIEKMQISIEVINQKINDCLQNFFTIKQINRLNEIMSISFKNI